VGTLEIEIEDRGGTIIVRLSGEFDISGIRDFHRAMMELQERGPKLVCIDLRGLSFLGASGLRSLLDVQARARRDGFSLVVVKGPPLVQRVVEMTGVDRRLTFVDDPAEANGKDPVV
jgi:anti-anti-sigma factor